MACAHDMQLHTESAASEKVPTIIAYIMAKQTHVKAIRIAHFFFQNRNHSHTNNLDSF